MQRLLCPLSRLCPGHRDVGRQPGQRDHGRLAARSPAEPCFGWNRSQPGALSRRLVDDDLPAEEARASLCAGCAGSACRDRQRTPAPPAGCRDEAFPHGQRLPGEARRRRQDHGDFSRGTPSFLGRAGLRAGPAAAPQARRRPRPWSC